MKHPRLLLFSSTGLVAVAVCAAFLSNANLIKFNRTGFVRASAPTNTRRVWLVDNNGNSTDTNWWTGSTLYVFAWTSQAASTEFKVTEEVLSDYYKGLWYVDVTLTGVTTDLSVIVRVGNDSGAYAWGNNNQTFTQPLGEFGDSADVIWLNNGVTWDGDNNRNSRSASIGSAPLGAAQLSVVMSKYNTCSPNNTNGYHAYPQVKKDFEEPSDPTEFSTKVYGQDVYTIQDYLDAMEERHLANL